LKGNIMIVMEKLPERQVIAGYETDLRVERTDISFHDLTGDRDTVRIEITVHNAGTHRSPPTPMIVESAPLGAFVPWRPLAQLLVPALEPGESHQLTTEATRSHPGTLGDFNRVPPKRILTAVNSPDQPSPKAGSGLIGALNFFRKERPARSPGRKGKASLAPDLWDLLGRGQPHWAGNINVFIGHQAVERHLAGALRIYPGRSNLAMFVVGDPGRPDAYAFELVGLAPDWQVGLHDVTNSRDLRIGPADVPIEEMEWVESEGGLLVILATRPPAKCERGNLEVHVTRRSCGKTALVEFDLDPNAAGTGCYFV
jgi:hypothetical protein